MKQADKERRVINIKKEDYDFIKKYCDDNVLNLPRWITKIIINHIKENQKI